MMRKLRFRKLPEIAKLLLLNHRAWLVGSTAAWYLADGRGGFNDVDLMVPFGEWMAVSRVIRTMFGEEVALNNLGGFKLDDQGVDVDVWPMSLDDFLPSNRDGEYCVRIRPPTVVKTGL